MLNSSFAEARPRTSRPGPRLRTALAVALAAALAAGPAAAEGVALGAGVNFSQGWTGDAGRIARLGIDDVRDGMRWPNVETTPGTYAFDTPATSYPDALERAGIGMSLTVNFGNPLYDGGATPTSPEAVAAHARYVAALVARFPAIHTVEVGNEFNSRTFVKGALEEAGVEERAAAHVAMLKAVREALAGGRPVKVLGGAAHSIPLAYLDPVLDAGGAAFMDALAIHPYTSAPEEFGRQIAVLRRHPAARDLPLEVTEFGTETMAEAPGHLVRWLAVMAVNGVERAVWYPLNARGDGLVPLVDKGRPTAAGRAYAFAAERLARRAARDVSPDPMTFAVVFGGDTLVLWGEPRDVAPGAGVAAFDATGTPVEGPLRLAPDAPLVLVREGGIALGADVTLGDSGVLADSFYDFDFPAEDGTPPAGAFERAILTADGREVAFQTMPGQERGDAPWMPYLGRAGFPPLRMTARSLLPRGGGEAAAIVQRWVAPADGEVVVAAEFTPSERSEDGIAVTLRRTPAAGSDGTTLAEASGRDPIVMRERVRLEAGDRLELVVGAGGSHAGDVTAYRVRILTPDAPDAPVD